MPAVRATRGNRSGPMTTRATMPMTRSSEKPTSNMAARRLALLLFLDFAFDRAAGGGDLLVGLRGLVAALHAVLEALDGAAQVGADVAQLLRAEDEQHDDEHDQPMPDAEGTHGDSPGAADVPPLFLRDHARKRIGTTD